MDKKDIQISQEYDDNFETMNLDYIYKKLCIEDNIDFVFNDEQDMVVKSIQFLYDKDFLIIESKDIETNPILLNNQFVKLIKYCKTKHDYKKVHIIFLVFCDYFDLDYNKTFIELHEKIRELIEHFTCKMIGQKLYDKYLERTKPTDCKINTLFDLIKKK